MIRIIALLLTIQAISLGHGMRSGFLEIQETAAGSAIVTWKVLVNDTLTAPELPEHCTPTDSQAKEIRPGTKTFTVTCNENLAGSSLAVRGMGTLITETVVRVKLSDGTTSSTVLTKDSPEWQIPSKQTPLQVSLKYIGLGIVHILEGWDHLLFVVGLFFIVSGFRPLLITCSAFTLAHSCSLAFVTLNWIHFPPAVAEACIALSLVLIALDMGIKGRGTKHGTGMAFVFGLVHGLGFAGALSEIGLPADAIPVSLLGFNLGVEMGQVTILALLAILSLLAKRIHFEDLLLKGAVYSVGGFGAFWFFERLAVCLGYS